MRLLFALFLLFPATTAPDQPTVPWTFANSAIGDERQTVTAYPAQTWRWLDWRFKP